MTTLYISDLDGTLLTSEGTLSDQTVREVNALLEQGVNFTFATARTSATALPLTSGLNLTLPVILMNGVMIYDPPKQEALQEWRLPQEVVPELIELFEERQAPTFLYTMRRGRNLHVYYKTETEMMRRFREERQLRYNKPFDKVQSLRDVNGDEIVFFNLMAPKAVLDPLADVLASYPVTVQYYRDVYLPNTWFLEIYHKDASKGTALSYLRQAHGFEHVVAFGDNYNDLSMFEEADLKVAVANAVPELRQLADVTIGSNDHDSVATFMREHSRRYQG